MCVRARRCQCSSTESARSLPQRLYIPVWRSIGRTSVDPLSLIICVMLSVSDVKLQYLTWPDLFSIICKFFEHQHSTAYLHEIGKHQGGLCNHCNKPETICHCVTECSHRPTCLAVLAACKRLNFTRIIGIIFSDGRLRQHNRIISSVDRKLNFEALIIRRPIFGGCN